jgi:cAMP-dependent protein kinase regulator
MFVRKRRASVSAEPGLETLMIQKKKPKELIEKLVGIIKRVLICADLDQEQLEWVAEAMEIMHVEKGNEVIVQGDEGDFFYIVEKGEFDVVKIMDDGAEHKVFEHKDSGYFGELALMYNCPRSATVRAKTDGVLWKVDRKTFRTIIVASQKEKRNLYENFLNHVEVFSKDLFRFLFFKKFFKGNLTPNELAQVIDCVTEKSFKDGEYVIHQGEQGDFFYLISDGVAKAIRDTNLIGLMRKGDFFGERALMTSEPRACDVIAIGQLKVICMERQQFERLLGPCNDILQRRIQRYAQLSR